MALESRMEFLYHCIAHPTKKMDNIGAIGLRTVARNGDTARKGCVK